MAHRKRGKVYINKKERSVVKRPDKDIYVPRHLRSGENSPVNTSPKSSRVNAKQKNHNEEVKEIKNKKQAKKQSTDEKTKIIVTPKTNRKIKSTNDNEKQSLATLSVKHKPDKASDTPNELKNANNENTISKIEELEKCAPCHISISEGKLFVLESYSEILTNTVLHDVYTSGNHFSSSRISYQSPRHQRIQISPEQQNKLLPGMATNFVNTAIENAMEMLRAVKQYEKRASLCKPPLERQLLFQNRKEGCKEIEKNTNDPLPGFDGAGSSLQCNKKYVSYSNRDIVCAQDDIEKCTEKKFVPTGDKKDSCLKKNGIKIMGASETKNKEVKTFNKEDPVLDEKEVKSYPNSDSENNCKNLEDRAHKNNNIVVEWRKEKSIKKKPLKLKKNNKGSRNFYLNDDDKIEKKLVDSSKRIVKVYHNNTEKTETQNLTNEHKFKEHVNEKIDVKNLDDWDSNWTDDGDCLNGDMIKELSELTGIQNPLIENAEIIDYLDFKPKTIELDDGEFGHILELFDFSEYLKTQDLFNALSTLGVTDYNITWVDDTHALAVFSSRSAAHTAMKQYTPVLQMKQVINGTRQAKLKAREFKDALLPYKRRPAASALVARNLITGALGIKSQLSSEQRKKEREILKEAREQKKKKQKQKKDIWNDPE